MPIEKKPEKQFVGYNRATERSICGGTKVSMGECLARSHWDCNQIVVVKRAPWRGGEKDKKEKIGSGGFSSRKPATTVRGLD